MNTKQELRAWLEADKRALHVPDKRKHPLPIHNEIWKYEIFLRKREYWMDRKGYTRLIPYAYYTLRWYRLGMKLGFSIPAHTFGPGLSIAHRGPIVVNENARIGKNCRIQECVTIGATGGSAAAPRLGDRVFIGSGARIIGDISIASGVAIGANAAVVKSCEEENVTLAGVPARIVSRKGSASMITGV